MNEKLENDLEQESADAGSTPPADKPQTNNPLHGVKLVDMVEYLVQIYGWEELGCRVNIKCFNFDPSIKSSLKFLRKTPWARDKVEQLYLYAKRKRAES